MNIWCQNFFADSTYDKLKSCFMSKNTKENIFGKWILIIFLLTVILFIMIFMVIIENSRPYVLWNCINYVYYHLYSLFCKKNTTYSRYQTGQRTTLYRMYVCDSFNKTGHYLYLALHKTTWLLTFCWWVMHFCVSRNRLVLIFILVNKLWWWTISSHC